VFQLAPILYSLAVFFKKTKTATTIISFFRAHKRVITFSFVALCAFWLTPSWSEAGPYYFVLAFVLFVMLIAGQLFWVGRVIGLGERFILGGNYPVTSSRIYGKMAAN